MVVGDPGGHGLAVHLLRQKYTTVSAVFSSRKALVADVKTAWRPVRSTC
jgi:hypothetical protein